MAELPDLPRTEAAIIDETNAFRRAERLEPVKPNGELTRAARQFAEYLARTGRFAHEADGRKPADRVGAAGYKHCMISENLALNQDSRGFSTARLASEAVTGWKNSPGHRRNMVEPHVTEIGVGVAKAADAAPKFLSVQLFGRPASLSYKFRVENRAGVVLSYTIGGQRATAEPRVVVTHTGCVPAEIVFERAGNALTGTGLGSRFPTRDGAVFALVRAADGAVKIEVESQAPAAKPKDGRR